ncbi:MAG: hypothetical protein K2L98_02240, partial [Bacilli bacterium]|nr:hypothetical protein [Bacilli bacterium]
MAEQESFRIRTIREQAEKIEYREKRNWSEEKFNDFLRTIDTYLHSEVINKEILMELRNYFNLSTDYWLFIRGDNCYAYALGCDLPERR